MAALLQVERLSAGHGGGDVVHGAGFDVDEGEAVAIIGANGAGKTTLLRAVCGMLRASSGSVRLDGRQVLGAPAHVIARMGLAYVPAERHLFPMMTVMENLELGAYPARPDPRQRELVFALFPALARRRGQRAGTMSGGEQQMLAVGRALMAKPRVLMLDEPTTGLAPKLAAEAYRTLAVLRGDGLTVVAAEQHVPLALGLADRGYVVEDGRVTLHGAAGELADNPDVRRAYLGIV